MKSISYAAHTKVGKNTSHRTGFNKRLSTKGASTFSQKIRTLLLLAYRDRPEVWEVGEGPSQRALARTG